MTATETAVTIFHCLCVKRSSLSQSHLPQNGCGLRWFRSSEHPNHYLKCPKGCDSEVHHTHWEPDAGYQYIDWLTRNKILAWPEWRPYDEHPDFKPMSKENRYPNIYDIVHFSVGSQSYQCQYLRGVGHLYQPPGQRPGMMDTQDGRRAVWTLCNMVKPLGFASARGTVTFLGGAYYKYVAPNIAEVISCIRDDAQALDYQNYESWARDMGFDPDSRKGFDVFNKCRDNSMKFASVVGWDAFAELRKLEPL